MSRLAQQVASLESEVIMYRRQDALQNAFAIFHWRDEEESAEKRIVISQDSTPPNPRKLENLWVFLFKNRRISGDKDPSELSEEAREDVKARGGHIVHVYGHIHSGISLSLTPFNEQFDCGTVGIAAAFPADIAAWKKRREQMGETGELDVMAQLEHELDLYEKYVNGEVYCAIKYDTEWQEEESCGGFFGMDWWENGAMYAMNAPDKELVHEVRVGGLLPDNW